MCRATGKLLLLALLAAAPAAAQSIEVAEPFPLQGEPVTVTVTGEDGVPLAGAELSALYRPNSETSHTEPVGTTDASGQVRWTPTDPGIVTLTAGPSSQPVASANVAVRFGAFPPQGLAIMVLAGVLLFGGAGFGFARMLGAPPAPPEHEPPST